MTKSADTIRTRSPTSRYILLGVGILGLFFLAASIRFSGRKSLSPVPTRATTFAPVLQEDLLPPVAPDQVASEKTEASSPVDPRLRIAEKNFEHYVATLITNVVRGKLDLTDEELGYVILNVVAYMHRKGDIEKEILRVESVSDGIISATIPPYPERGAQLRSELMSKIQADVGIDGAARVSAHLGQTLEFLFRGFGSFEQRFDVQYSASRKEDAVVHWSVALGASQKGPVAANEFGYGGSSGTTFVPVYSMLSGPDEPLYPHLIKFLGPR